MVLLFFTRNLHWCSTIYCSILYFFGKSAKFWSEFSMKLGFVQWPEGLLAHSPAWQTIHEQVTAANLDILLTNELPFGPWIARLPVFDRATAQESVAAHEAGLEALKALPTKLVISSRPVWCGDRLANEAFSLEKGGEYRCLHQKHFFPAEPGWHETTWFHCGKPGFEVRKSINQPINQSINQRIDRSINQSIAHSFIRSTNQSIKQSINQSTNPLQKIK